MKLPVLRRSWIDTCVAVRGVLLATALLPWQIGCTDSASGPDGGEAKSILGPAAAPNEAEQLLQRMIAAFQNADSYADRGELRISFRRDGRLFESQTPFSTLLVRPNKLQMHLYQGHVVCDGTTLWGWTDDLPGYVLKMPHSSPLTLGEIYSDEVMRSVLSEGQVGGSLQLTMLLGSDALELIRAGGERPELLADEEIRGAPCRRVRVRRADGNLTYWIDRESLVLRRIEYPTGRALRMTAFASATDLTMTAEFVDPQLNANIPPEAFQFDPPTTVKVVDKLDPFVAVPPPPPPAQTLGQKLGDFQVKRLDGADMKRADLAGKAAVVLFWSVERSESLSVLDRLNTVYEKYRTRPNLQFLAVCIDAGGEAGIPDAELRDVMARHNIVVPAARDVDYSAVRAFDAQFVPSLYLVSADGTVEDNEIGLNRNAEDELPARLDKLLSGQSLVADARERYAERLRKYEQSQQAAGGGAGVASSLPQATVAARRDPQKLKMTERWTTTEIAKPGYMLATTEKTGSSRVVVADGLRGVTELDSHGKVVKKLALDLPTVPNEAVVSFWRTTVDKQGKRLFIGSASAQQQLHVFDDGFKRILSFPESTHAGISDVQLADLDGDGEPEINVGYWGVVGVQNVSLDGTRRWSNRRLAENVLRLAVARTPGAATAEPPKRLLWCITGVMTAAVLNDVGQTVNEMPIGARALRLAALDDLNGDGIDEMCGIATVGPGTDAAIGFNAAGSETWNYPLPPGVQPVPEMQNEIVASGKLLRDEPGLWVFAGADGTVHFVGGDGKPVDAFAWGKPLHGLAVGAIEGVPTLFLSDDKSVTALQFTR